MSERHCRLCKQELTGQEGIDYIMRSKGYYYHKTCWEKYNNMDVPKTDDEWFDLIFEIITKDCHSTYNFFQIKSQCAKMIAEGKTMKGIYFTAYWYFVLQKKEYKPEYGLGIIPYVYDQSTNYWLERQRKETGILEEISKIKKIEAGIGRSIGSHNKRSKHKITAEPVL